MSSQDSACILAPQEEALQALCKTLLKSRLFRGYYKERRHVDVVGGYRDIVALQRDERELQKLLRDMQHKLHIFYQHQRVSKWIGITYNPDAVTSPPGALNTYIWAELADLAFGQYWFSIKTVRFRDNEILLKLKAVRPIEDDPSEVWHRPRLGMEHVNLLRSQGMRKASTSSGTGIDQPQRPSPTPPPQQSPISMPAKQIGLQDFTEVIQHWGASIKHTLYQFMSEDINKENIKGLLRFIGLVIVSLLSGLVVAIKFLGGFVLRFMFECSRITHALTPITLKIIEVLSKIAGGFFILIAMIWRDLINKRQPAPVYNKLEYKRPPLESIQYTAYPGAHRSKSGTGSDFERKFQ